MASRYSWTVPQIEALSVMDLAEIFKKVQEMQKRSDVYAEWTVLQPFMIIKWMNFMPFEEYYNARTGADIDMRPASEILAEAEDIQKHTGVK